MKLLGENTKLELVILEEIKTKYIHPEETTFDLLRQFYSLSSSGLP